MENIFNIQLILIIVSFVANTFSALAGGGAGLIQFPALIFLGLPFAKALATHKVATIALGVGASMKFFKDKSLDKKMSLYVLGAGIPGVILGALSIVNISEKFATGLLGTLTLSLGLYSIMKHDLGTNKNDLNRSGTKFNIGLCFLFLIGFLNGSLSSGTGLFVTLFLIRWFGYDYKHAIAITLVNVGIWWNLTGAITLGLQSKIQWDWVFVLILGSFAGGYFGASIAISKGNHFIKRAFEFVTIAIGIKLLLP
ncbi:sulfite exporter TauE/SafE family protein [bacterium]|mgnify:FL=1|jgi:uncharacterized protein|nr:sulfite exporter TauE/SafE family protein [bacterium]